MSSSGVRAMLILAAVVSAAGSAVEPSNAGKIEPLLLERLAGSGASDFIVVFTETAELSPAYEMGWRERGEFVYDSLRAVSEQSQASVRFVGVMPIAREAEDVILRGLDMTPTLTLATAAFG